MYGRSVFPQIFGMGLIVLLLAGCGGAPAEMTSTPTSLPPTATLISTPTGTPIPIPTSTPLPTYTPEPTPLPGKLVYPLDSLSGGIPWLIMDNAKRPGTTYFYFNTRKAPFSSALVRQAFAAAIDREVIVSLAERYGAIDPRPATTFTPPETLGRDLYGEVGISFDPAKAKALFQDAGYSDASAFPEVAVLVNASGDKAPGASYNFAMAMADMWEKYLGVKVNVEAIGNWGTYLDRIASNPPEIFRLGWAADYNDPDNFLDTIFHTSSEYNYGGFSNTEFDGLVERAAVMQGPALRQQLYIQAERILTEQEAAIIPLFHTTYNIQ